MFAFGSWQGAAGSQRLELMLPNLGTMGYHCKELPVPEGWNWWFPTWEPKVTMARNCRFRDLETYGSQPGNQRLPFIARNCRFPDVPKAWNSWFQTWKSNVTSGRICWLQKIRTHGSSCCFGLFTEWVTELFVLLPGPVTECLRSAAGPA